MSGARVLNRANGLTTDAQGRVYGAEGTFDPALVTNTWMVLGVASRATKVMARRL